MSPHPAQWGKKRLQLKLNLWPLITLLINLISNYDWIPNGRGGATRCWNFIIRQADIKRRFPATSFPTPLHIIPPLTRSVVDKKIILIYWQLQHFLGMSAMRILMSRTLLVFHSQLPAFSRSSHPPKVFLQFVLHFISLLIMREESKKEKLLQIALGAIKRDQRPFQVWHLCQQVMLISGEKSH